MSHIPTPATIDASPAASQPLLHQVHKNLGVVPNLFRLVATSPAALEGFLSLHAALNKGQIDAPTRERIALAVAEANGCNYCLAAHTYIGSQVAKLTHAEIAANRRGGSTDAKAHSAVTFASAIARQRGRVDASAVEQVRQAGFSDAEVIEIIALVALNTLTNYVNEVLDTEIDFPAAPLLQAS